MPRVHQKILEFANFTLNFGEKRMMADLLDEVVIPAFTDGSLERTYDETTYSFVGTKVLNLSSNDEPIPAIAGTFVKDMMLRRDQTLDREHKVIVPKPGKMKSAPTATFVLLLTNHKLLYLHETSHAPSLDTFRATAHAFLKKKYFDFIDRIYGERRQNPRNANERKITKRSLRIEFLPPELSIVPLPSEESLTEAVERFKTISRIKIDLLPVNSERHNAPFLKTWREMVNALGATKASLVESEKDGLNSEAVIAQIKEAAAEGNARVELKGKTPDAQGLKIDNEDMRLTIPVSNVPDDIEGKAKLLNQIFDNLVQDKTITVADVDEEQAKKIRDKFR